MRNSHLLSIQKEAHLSPEQLAERIGISGMTLRRWRQGSTNQNLPKIYERALVGVIGDLMAEGRLALDSPGARLAMEQSSFEPVPQKSFLGITADMLKEGTSKQLVESLYKIGGDASHVSQIDKSQSQIFSFKKMGKEWRVRISSLWTVLNSDELHTFDKCVAYGALFYLLMPFDLIPDSIPVIGSMDDFIILGFAVAYYVKRFPLIVKQSS
jgi:uncharacterized membrane protein YkvA (DUF1232 family)